MLRSVDRNFLKKAQILAADARRPPVRLGLPLEPTWAAVIAQQNVAVAEEVQLPGDPEDAIRRAWKKLKNRAVPEELTLYLTLEPSAIYQRIPAVTESIRETAIRRVVIGTEDPFLRQRHRGIAALENQGLEVILADGEEARDCQLLCEDYAKATNRMLPLVRTIGRIRSDDGRFQVQTLSGASPFSVDAEIHDSSEVHKNPDSLSERTWHAVLDTHGHFSDGQLPAKLKGERVILCTATDLEVKTKPDLIKEKVAAIVSAPAPQGVIDLASLLRKLRDLGLMSVQIGSSGELWVRAVRAGLIDHALFAYESEFHVSRTLSELASAPLFAQTEIGSYAFQLRQPRLVRRTQEGAWIEAEVTLAEL